MGHSYTKTRVTYTVHEPQYDIGKSPFAKVVFYQDSSTGHAGRLVEEDHGILGVVEYVHKHDNIVAAIAIRQSQAIILFDRNMIGIPNEDLNSLKADIRATPAYQ